MTWRPAAPIAHAPPLYIAAFFTGFIAIVFITRKFAQRALRRRAFKKFERIALAARVSIPVWLAVGVYLFHWGDFVHAILGRVSDWPVHLPGAIIGLAPSVLAWIGLWWAQYPLESATNQSNHQSLRSYFICNIRLQLLFTIAPIMLVMLAHDMVMLALWRGEMLAANSETTEAIVSAIVLGVVFLLAPEILRRVLQTEPMQDSPLRQRLENLCRRHKLKFRDIVVWRTGNTTGNAAVMGIIPQVRFILLSDLLLKSMSDDQIEAVFAHEVGHIVHWHIAWYLVVMMILTLCAGAVGDATESMLQAIGVSPEIVSAGVFCAAFVFVFGFISRKLERQADVFAARTLEPQDTSIVGPHGAELFASALHRIAWVNNVPVATKSWCHGSIFTRMKYLEHLSADPEHTSRFDRFMRRMYGTLAIALLTCGVYVATSSAKSSHALPTPAAIQQTSAALPH